MPELARLTFASTEIMPGLFGMMRLKIDRDAVDLSRTSSVGGLPYLADHDMSRPLGRIVKTEIRDSLGYAEAHVPTVSRSEPYLEELRAHLRDGVSPGLYLRAVEFVEEDGELIEHVTRWMCFEISSVTAPRMQNIGLISLEKTRDKASITGLNRVPPAAPVARARVTEPILTAAERARRMSGIEERVDAKLAALAQASMAADEREQSQAAAAKTGVATGEVQRLDEMLLALTSLASNPSANTPRMSGVEVLTAVRNHVVARVPTVALALTSADIPGSEIETTAPVLTQPQGRGSARLLSRFKPASPAFGSERFPVLDTAPVAGMRTEGQAALAIVDPTFRTPALEVAPHLAQVRQSFSQQLLVQTGGAFRDAVDESLRLALMALMARQAVVGDGVAPNLRGLANVAGTGTSDYAMTDRGGAATFRDAEDVFENASFGEQLRPTWLLSGELYQLAKRTVQGTWRRPQRPGARGSP